MKKLLTLTCVSMILISCTKEIPTSTQHQQVVVKSIITDELITHESYLKELEGLGLTAKGPVQRGIINCWLKSPDGTSIQGKMCTAGGNDCSVDTSCK